MNTDRHLASDRPAAVDLPVVASPRVSVIVPSFNSARFLRDALASALDQDPKPHEVLVQDGGSTDNTIEILGSFGPRVAWISAPDRGQSDALNRALERATGDIILWLNADDLIAPGALAAAVAAFTRDRDLSFAYGDFDMIDEEGSLMRTYRSSAYSWNRVFSRGCYIFSGSLFIRRRALDEIGGYDDSLRACMDLDLLLRLKALGHFTHVGRTVGRFRMHGASKSSTMRLEFLKEGWRVRRKYAGRSPRLWLIALWATVWSGFMDAIAPLRYSSSWPRHGGRKTL